jgi:hypothetical protein
LKEKACLHHKAERITKKKISGALKHIYVLGKNLILAEATSNTYALKELSTRCIFHHNCQVSWG